MENKQEPAEQKKHCMFFDIPFRFAVKLHPEIIEIILRIVLEKPGLKVKGTPIPQADFKSLSGRSVIADVLAEEEDGTQIIIELHNSWDLDEVALRSQYEGAMLLTHVVKPGVKFENKEDRDNIPEQYTVFLCRGDILNLGKPYYDLEPCFVNVEGNPSAPSKTHIRILNGAYREKDSIGMLMRDLCETDPQKLQFPGLRDIFSKILTWDSKVTGKEELMNHDEQDYYEFVCDEQMKRLKEENDAMAATIDAQASALNDKDATIDAQAADLARYQAIFGPLPSQQPPASPQA
ncbi:MAG: hypothetical protein IJ228_01385 [Succinivibrio sp.]|nr:hypothetical protein [Succinivibrio sp.]